MSLGSQEGPSSCLGWRHHSSGLWVAEGCAPQSPRTQDRSPGAGRADGGRVVCTSTQWSVQGWGTQHQDTGGPWESHRSSRNTFPLQAKEEGQSPLHLPVCSQVSREESLPTRAEGCCWLCPSPCPLQHRGGSERAGEKGATPPSPPSKGPGPRSQARSVIDTCPQHSVFRMETRGFK